MSVLSVLQEDSSIEPGGTLVACANWIVLTCDPQFRPGEEVTFEVQEVDANLLKARLRSREQYFIDAGPLFWAELTSLEYCHLSAEAFCFLGGHRLRCVLTVRPAL